MQVSIVGYSSIVSRKVIPALMKFRNINKINIFTRRAEILSEKINDNDKINFIDLNELENLLKQKKSLVSIMHANNETGVLQPIKEIGKLCKKYKSIFIKKRFVTSCYRYY